MEHTPAEVRSAVVKLFRANKEIKDPRVVDMLVMKGQLTFEECMLQHFSKMHVHDTLWPQKLATNKITGDDFLGKFYRGID